MKLAKLDPLDIQVIIPQYENLPAAPDPLRDKLRDASILYLGFGKGFAALVPILGKVILKIRDTEAWREWGWRTFSEFMTTGMERDFSVPSSQAWYCYRLVEKWPSLDVSDCIAIGSVKLRELSRVSAEGEKNSGKWVERAKELSPGSFKDEVTAHLGTTVSKDKLVRIELSVTSETRERFTKEFPPIAERAIGSLNDDLLLNCMMDECYSSWQRQP